MARSGHKENTMNIHKLFPSKWVMAADLERDVTVKMRALVLEDVGRPPKNETKPVLYFHGTEKGLILNKTNGLFIAGMYGAETDNWMGKRITLYSTQVRAFGSLVDAVRVKSPGVVSSAPPEVIPEAEPEDIADYEDEDTHAVTETPTSFESVTLMNPIYASSRSIKPSNMDDVDELNPEGGDELFDIEDAETGLDPDSWNPAWTGKEHFQQANAWGMASGKFSHHRHHSAAWSKCFAQFSGSTDPAGFLAKWRRYVNDHEDAKVTA